VPSGLWKTSASVTEALGAIVQSRSRRRSHHDGTGGSPGSAGGLVGFHQTMSGSTGSRRIGMRTVNGWLGWTRTAPVSSPLTSWSLRTARWAAPVPGSRSRVLSANVRSETSDTNAWLLTIMHPPPPSSYDLRQPSHT
jgi:hypothetical protein